MNSEAWVDVAAEEAAEDAVHSAIRVRQNAKSTVYETSY